MAIEKQEIPDLNKYRTPESKMELSWKEVGDKASGLKQFVASKGWVIKGILNGGGLYEAENISNDADQKVLYSERPIAVVVTVNGKVIHWPTEKISQNEQNEKRFDSNLAAYRGVYAGYLDNQQSIKDLGYNPIPKASIEIVDDRYVTVSDYREGVHGLGTGSPGNGIHEFDTHLLSPKDMEKLVRAIDACHVSSKKFYESVDQATIPDRSWFKFGYKIAFRGKEWWLNIKKRLANAEVEGEVINENKEYGDRLGELYMKVAESEKMKALFQSIAPDLKIRKALKDMITNNQFLYPKQNAEISEINDMMVVVHGILYPDNIHAYFGEDRSLRFMISGGDRSQGVGLRGQEIDWLVSACAASPEHQYALINAFLKIQKENGRNVALEKRGLAMHVLYRAISEGRWYADDGKMKEAENLVRLTRDILSGNDIWQGVNTVYESPKE